MVVHLLLHLCPLNNISFAIAGALSLVPDPFLSLTSTKSSRCVWLLVLVSVNSSTADMSGSSAFTEALLWRFCQLASSRLASRSSPLPHAVLVSKVQCAALSVTVHVTLALHHLFL